MRYRRPQNYKEKLEDYQKKNIIVQKDQVGKEEGELYLEIGMGRGNFIVEHARRFPQRTYIGIEKQAPLLISASSKVEAMDLKNLKLMSFDANNIDEIFAEDQVSGIYLNFSDPWSKQRYAKRRLTHRLMLEKYAMIMRDQALLVFKTDNEDLFYFSMEEIKQSPFELTNWELDLYQGKSEGLEEEPKFIQTEYEKKFINLGRTIYYLECKLNKG